MHAHTQTKTHSCFMQRPLVACRHPAAATSCGPACQEGAPGGTGAGEEGCRKWGRSSAGAWEAGRGRAMPKRRTRREGRTETGSLRGRDSSPASGGPSEHAHTRAHTHTRAGNRQGRGGRAGSGFACDQEASQEGQMQEE